MDWNALMTFGQAADVGYLQYAWERLLNIVQVILGVGAVIFVHELGHFAIAKWCGVKCEKFYLGFDIGGWKILSFRRGETEYGIGVLPLGGYVKMLGQDDNPGEMQAELERAKRRDGLDDEDAADSADTPRYDPRSFPAQSVYRRMAIISGGVVMNVIFAYLFVIAAHLYGVHASPVDIPYVRPGSPAWRADVRSGDVMTMMGDRPNPEFRHLMADVKLREFGPDGIAIQLKRAGESEPLKLSIAPEMADGGPQLGISAPVSRNLYRKKPTMPGSPAAEAKVPFRSRDEVVAVDGKDVTDFAAIHRIACEKADRPLTYKVRRKDSEDLSIEVAPNPMRDLGLNMAIGAISAVRKGSPAERAGLRVNDAIRKIDGKPIEDPIELPQRLYRSAGREIEIEVQRNQESVVVRLVPEPRPAWGNPPILSGDAMELGAIGVACRVLNHVNSVKPNVKIAAVKKPATGSKPGDDPKSFLKDANIVKLSVEKLNDLDGTTSRTFDFGDVSKTNWPFLVYTVLDGVPLGDAVEVELDNGAVLKLAVQPSATEFHPSRGLLFEPLRTLVAVKTMAEALRLAKEDTIEFLVQPYLVLLNLMKSKLDSKMVGGPVRIFSQASAVADAGFGDFLFFLAVLSANLAVINFLPIPLLDGGHMCFLLWEWVVGKPADEKIQIYLSLAGFLFLIGLFLTVTFQDVRMQFFRAS